jgi:tRNA(Ile)-lysidine synthase
MTPEEVTEQVRASGLLSPAHSVVTMLSGGRDSVCLLDVAVRICGAQNVHALHVNYGLRPEAGVEERHCRALCDRLGVTVDVVRAERPPGSGNLQAWARERRYAVARELADEHDATIATGHTASDQIETILYRLAASPGRRALLGMVPREGRVLRPLLELTREQTADYCRARGLDWREDPSNDDEQFARARVRNRLLPALEAVHPAARENVLRTASLLREEAEVLDGLLGAELGGEASAGPGSKASVGRGGEGSVGRGSVGRGGEASVGPGASGASGDASIAIGRLRALAPALARLVVVRLAEDAAGTYVPQAGARVGEILALADRGGRAELHVGGHVGAVIEGGRLRMVRLPPHA